MSTSLDRMTKLELRQFIDKLQHTIAQQDRQITVQQGRIMILENEIQQASLTTDLMPRMTYRELSIEYCAKHKVRFATIDELCGYAQSVGVLIVPSR